MYQFEYPQQLTVAVMSVEQVNAVYAALAANPVSSRGFRPDHPSGASAVLENRVMSEVAAAQPTLPEMTETAESDNSEVEVDADGIPFDPELHTGTKLKDGRWRMKKGAERPEPENGNEGAKQDTAPASDGNGQNATTAASPSDEEDDEFAAFREAAASEPEQKPVEAAAREWSDADLGALCNQAALKLGGPDDVKALIAQYTPAGAVPHSRNIPVEGREEFAKALEAKADIEFAG